MSWWNTRCVATHLHVCLRAGWGCGKCLSSYRNKPPWPPHSHWPSETENKESFWRKLQHYPAQTSNFPRDLVLLWARQAMLLWQADQGSSGTFDQMTDWLSYCIIRPTGLKTQAVLNAMTDEEWKDVGVLRENCFAAFLERHSENIKGIYCVHLFVHPSKIRNPVYYNATPSHPAWSTAGFWQQ